MKDFKIFKSLLLLSSSLSCLLIGVAITSVAGCSDKRENQKDHKCKKYPAWHINPSKPIPKPKPPKKDSFKEILLKHSDWTNPFILNWDSKLTMETFPSSVIRGYLIKNLAPKLKYDYSKINFTGGIEREKGQPKPIIWYAIIQNDLTKITALFLTTPLHHVGIDFWVFAQT